MKKRVLVFVMALALLLVPLAGCKKKVDPTPAPTTKGDYDANGFENDDLPDNLNFDDDIKVLHWTEHQIGEFNPPEDSKDTIDKAIIQRDKIVEERLNITFRWTGTKGHWGSMSNFINQATRAYQGTEDDRYDLIGVYSQTAGALASKNLLLNLTDVDYLNFNKPWWPNSLLENSMVADKLWFVSGDICTSFSSELMDVTFNKSKFPDIDLYDLVDDGEWTLEKMIELSENLYFDADDEDAGKKSQGDSYGIVIPWWVYEDAFFYGCNLITVENDENHNLTVSSSYIGEKSIDLTDTLRTMFHRSNYGYLPPTEKDQGQAVSRIFARGDAAFYIAPPVMILTTQDLLETKVDYGILPMPKYDTAQKEYKSVHSNFLSLFGVFAKSDTAQADRAGAVLECLASEGYRNISPVLFEKCLKMRYANDSDTGRMYDIIRAGAVFDTGRIFASAGLEGITQDAWQKCAIFNKNWSTQVGSVYTQLREYLNAMTDNFRSMSQ